MNIIPINDAQDDRLRDYNSLTDVQLRKILEVKRGLYIAESEKVIERALQAGHQPRSILVAENKLHKVQPLLEGYPEIPVFVGEGSAVEAVTGFQVHRGALAAMHRPELPNPSDLLAHAHRVVILDELFDHSNVGLVFRSIAALGADAVFLTPSCADPLYRRSVRLSMGAVFQVPWTRLPGWHEAGPLLHEHGFEIAAFALRDDALSLEAFLQEVPDKVALLFGNEGRGLGFRALGAADTLVKISMEHGVDSLNVATSAAIALWATRFANQTDGGANEVTW